VQHRQRPGHGVAAEDVDALGSARACVGSYVDEI
jgi:hypothetical protein